MELVPFQCRIRRCSRPLTLPCRFRSMSSFKRPHVFSFSEEVSEDKVEEPEEEFEAVEQYPSTEEEGDDGDEDEDIDIDSLFG